MEAAVTLLTPLHLMPAERIGVGEPACSRLPGADYGDAFRVIADGYHSPEHWARRALESGSPLVRRLFALTVWQGALGLRLGPSPSREHVAGWKILENQTGIVVLRADSRLVTGVMVFDVCDARATWTTLLRYQAPPASAVWGVLGIAHRRIAPRVLTGASRSLGHTVVERHRPRST
jgi:hypothetical protein